MLFCTFCGQEFSPSQHLDRHTFNYFEVKSFDCYDCHFSFKRRESLQYHIMMAHRESEESSSSDSECKLPQRRAIACVACAKAKTKCDKRIPSCSRCTSKGLVCEARCTKRSSDAAYRLAKRQLSLYRRPVPIVSAESRISSPPTSSQNTYSYSPESTSGWDFNIGAQWSVQHSSSLMSILSEHSTAPPNDGLHPTMPYVNDRPIDYSYLPVPTVSVPPSPGFASPRVVQQIHGLATSVTLTELQAPLSGYDLSNLSMDTNQQSIYRDSEIPMDACMLLGIDAPLGITGSAQTFPRPTSDADFSQLGRSDDMAHSHTEPKFSSDSFDGLS